jgi:hypothetical protein
MAVQEKEIYQMIFFHNYWGWITVLAFGILKSIKA